MYIQNFSSYYLPASIEVSCLQGWPSHVNHPIRPLRVFQNHVHTGIQLIRAKQDHRVFLKNRKLPVYYNCFCSIKDQVLKKLQEKNLNKDLYKFICKYKDLCKTGMWLAAKKRGGNQISWGSALISVLTILTLANRRLVYLMFGTGEELGEEVHDGIPSQVLGTHHHMVVLAGLSGVVLSPGLLPLHPDGTDAFNLVNNNTTNNNTLYFFHIPNRTPTLYWI